MKITGIKVDCIASIIYIKKQGLLKSCILSERKYRPPINTEYKIHTRTCIHQGHLKSFKPHLERKARAEHFCWSNTQPILIKLENLIQISVLISV